MLQLFVNGPPGAGKTSLCKLLCEEFGLELVATGDLLRENILQRTSLGVVAKDCISHKSLVPDHVVVDMVAEKICECVHRKGWVLDGFPRTPEQSSALRRKQIFPSVVIVLELGEPECVKRITGRRFDPVTSKIYHMPNIMPRDATVLARLTKRSDDAPDRLPPRFEAYRQHGDATNALYDSVAHRVDVSRKPIQDVLETVVSLLHAIRPHVGGRGSESVRGNQAVSISPCSSSGAVVPPPAIRLHCAPLSASQSKRVSMALQRPVPQKIDEEDEEQATQDGESTYAPEVRPPAATPTAAPVTAPTAASSASLHHADELPRIEVNFKAMHVDMGRQMGMRSSPSASLASSPSSSPSHSPSSARGKAAPEAETFSFQASNNEDVGGSVAAASPPSSPTTHAMAARQPSGASGIDMAKFKDLLLDGFDVLKHGRRGSPHTRTIFADMEFKRIFWMKPGKEAKAKKAKLDQSLLLADVVQVLRGMKTEVLKRSGDVARYERYLSLVVDGRTLDLELPSEAMCDFLLRGFELLLHGSS
jgi:adenylate kinase family enzyme